MTLAAILFSGSLENHQLREKNMSNKTITLANPRGFCAGVDRAITIVERALEEFGAPIYVRH